MKVFLNPGHDLVLDPGACGHNLKEAEIVHQVGRLVEKYLVAAGVQVVGNVQDDDLHLVCFSANQSGADIFISIHCNAAANPLAKGTETFVYDFDSQANKLATLVQKQIVTSLETLNRGVKEANFYVLTKTSMPAILVELAFISNEDDAELLKTRADEFAREIARGVTDF
ncbi:MAG: N-acetylmuramoyl-L-alanine amidase [Prevotellaceae bacterium]|nr:N-acetylmuramoyl-L-alanine amidase [Prevotellaceae bacterium]